MKVAATKETREYFVKKFNELFDKWVDQGKAINERRTKVQFAEEVAKSYEKRCPDKECGINNADICKYLNGSKYPGKYLKDICIVLNVKQSVLKPQGHDEEYRYSNAFNTKHGKKLADYSKEIGLDLDFIRAVESITDFSKNFPLYSPLTWDNLDYTTSSVTVGRKEHAAAAKMDDSVNMFQVEKDGKIIDMSSADVDFLKEVQTNVSHYIERLFAARRTEMTIEEEQLKLKLISSDQGTMFMESDLKPSDYAAIDRFFKYNPTEEDK